MAEPPRPMSEQHRLELLADAISRTVAPKLRPECSLARDECGMGDPFMHSSTARGCARELLEELHRAGLDLVRRDP